MMKILIAEDDDVSRKVLSSMLRKQGHEVVETADGMQAWENVQDEQTPGLLILDVMMPGKDGLRLCREIREEAGSIGVLLAGNRQDFVTLVQALVYKNEPVPVPESLGAFMVSGYKNWERIKNYRRQWMQGRKESADGLAWSLEFL
ncbi:MAG: response regulator, partial [Desulfovermiculus sp.]